MYLQIYIAFQKIVFYFLTVSLLEIVDKNIFEFYHGCYGIKLMPQNGFDEDLRVGL